MDIGEKIKTLRKQRGLTLEAVGEHVGVGKSTVRKWENGDIKNMRRDKIALLAEALGVTPGYLMGWESAREQLRAIGEQLTGPSRSKKFIMISKGLPEFERMENAAFDALCNFLTTTYPNIFKERDDDDDTKP